MDTAAAVSPFQGKLFRLPRGTTLFADSDGWSGFGKASIYTADSDYCLRLEEEAHVPKSIPPSPRMDFVEVLIGQEIWWVRREHIPL